MILHLLIMIVTPICLNSSPLPAMTMFYQPEAEDRMDKMDSFSGGFGETYSFPAPMLMPMLRQVEPIHQSSVRTVRTASGKLPEGLVGQMMQQQLNPASVSHQSELYLSQHASPSENHFRSVSIVSHMPPFLMPSFADGKSITATAVAPIESQNPGYPMYFQVPIVNSPMSQQVQQNPAPIPMQWVQNSVPMHMKTVPNRPTIQLGQNQIQVPIQMTLNPTSVPMQAVPNYPSVFSPQINYQAYSTSVNNHPSSVTFTMTPEVSTPNSPASFTSSSVPNNQIQKETTLATGLHVHPSAVAPLLLAENVLSVPFMIQYQVKTTTPVPNTQSDPDLVTPSISQSAARSDSFSIQSPPSSLAPQVPQNSSMSTLTLQVQPPPTTTTKSTITPFEVPTTTPYTTPPAPQVLPAPFKITLSIILPPAAIASSTTTNTPTSDDLQSSVPTIPSGYPSTPLLATQQHESILSAVTSATLYNSTFAAPYQNDSTKTINSNMQYEPRTKIKSKDEGHLKEVKDNRVEIQYGEKSSDSVESITSSGYINVQSGKVSWTSPECITFTLTYIADENGYRPNITESAAEGCIANNYYSLRGSGSAPPDPSDQTEL